MRAARQVIDLGWLVRLRWLTIGAQGLSIATAAATSDLPLPLTPALVVLVLTLLSNGVLFALRARLGDGLIGPVLMVDTLALTASLHVTGGAMNPFSALYFVHLTFAAVVLPGRWVWGLTGASLLGFGALLLLSDGPLHTHSLVAHVRGMWVAFAVAAGLVAVFVTRLTAQLASQQVALEEAELRAETGRRVAALTGLAAGAAHELGTPIGTIALAAGELDRALLDAPAEVREDITLIREEVRRCRRVLDQLSTSAGELPGERLVAVPFEALAEAAIARLDEGERQRVEVHTDGANVRVPKTAVAQALASLLRNALDASEAGDAVWLRLERAGEEVKLSVEDRGTGMPEEVCDRSRLPFFSTKPEGSGMGLGLFLVDALAQQLGGRLALRSTEGRGTTAMLCLPTHASAEAPS
ncbi:MAG: ATP-binding protein [Sandaracinaceae bacterium]